MTAQNELIRRNRALAADFNGAELPILPKLGTVLLACVDARVDPAHVLGLELGDAVVIRNTGGRVTRAVIDEIATLAVLVSAMTEGREPGFNVVLMQHTQCGAQRLADPGLQGMLQEKLGIDVSEYAITDQASDMITDIERLRDADVIPDTISISAMLYDVATGAVREIASTTLLGSMRSEIWVP